MLRACIAVSTAWKEFIRFSPCVFSSRVCPMACVPKHSAHTKQNFDHCPAASRALLLQARPAESETYRAAAPTPPTARTRTSDAGAMMPRKSETTTPNSRSLLHSLPPATFEPLSSDSPPSHRHMSRRSIMCSSGGVFPSLMPTRSCTTCQITCRKSRFSAWWDRSDYALPSRTAAPARTSGQ